MVTTLQAEVALDAHAQLGEGPVWDPRSRRLLWLDIEARQVHLFAPGAGVDRGYDVGGRPGCAAFRAGGGVILAREHGFATLDLASGAVAPLLDVEPASAASRMNDGKCDAAGRFWAGTMALDHKSPGAALYRLEPDGAVAPMLAGVTISNGLAWTADNRTLYYIDTPTHGVDAFDFDLAEGRIANRRRVIDVPASLGSPDGMTIDADDCLWVAIWGGGCVRRYTPDGRLDRIVELPTRYTSCPTFGGAALDELYITTSGAAVPAEQRPQQPHAGGLFVCRPGVAGRSAFEFAG
jgi:sugar lactone lactonase YvrE